MRLLLTLIISLSMLPAWAIVPTKLTPKNEWAISLRKRTDLGRGLFQFGRPVVDGRAVYAGSATAGIYAAERTGGKVVWHVETAGPVYAPVRVRGETIYAADAKGHVYALNKSDGAKLWERELMVELMTQPLVYNNTVYLTSQQGELIALSESDGNIRWRTPRRIVSSMFIVKGGSDPVLVGDTIIVGYPDGRVVAHAARNGDVRWEQRIAPRSAVLHDVDSTIVPYNKKYFVSSAVEGGLSLRSVKHGLPLWTSKVASPNDIVIDGDTAFVTGRSAVFAVNLKNGSTLWQRSIDEGELNAPIMVDGSLIVASTENKLFVLDPSDGRVLGERYVSGGTYGDFASAQQQLFVLTNANRLQALRMPSAAGEDR